MKGPVARFVQDKVRLAVVLVLFPLGLSLFADAHWLLELATHFQAHYLAALLLCLLLLLGFRDARWSMIATAGAVLAGASVVPFYFGKPEADATTGGVPFRLLLSNVYTQNTQSARLLELTRAERIDLAVFQEIDRRWLEELKPLQALLPAVRAIPREDNFGIGVWSRSPLLAVQEIESGPFEVPMILAQCEAGGRKLQIIAAHPVPPASAEGAAARDAQLAEVAAIAREASLPVILIGDLNATMWSPAYRRLIAASRLHDARKGFGILPTWPAQFGAAGIPLDHCLASPELRVREIRTGAPIGSDHLPLIVELIIPN